MTIGEKIKALRKEKHMTQAEVAGGAVTNNMLCLIEKNKAVPSMDTICRIAETLDVPVEYFFGSEELFVYRKQKEIPRIRTALKNGKYKRCISLLDALGGEDDETYYIRALAAFRAGALCIRGGDLADADMYFRMAEDAAQKTVYDTTRLSVLLPLYRPVSRNIQSPLLDFDKYAYLDACAVCDDADFYHYLIQDTKYFYKTARFSEHMKAKALMKDKKYAEALEVLHRMEEHRTEGEYDAFVVLGIYSDMEQCYKEMCDFEGAYRYAEKRFTLTENFRR